MPVLLLFRSMLANIFFESQWHENRKFHKGLLFFISFMHSALSALGAFVFKNIFVCAKHYCRDSHQDNSYPDLLILWLFAGVIVNKRHVPPCCHTSTGNCTRLFYHLLL